jgi:hypothetical protein
VKNKQPKKQYHIKVEVRKINKNKGVSFTEERKIEMSKNRKGKIYIHNGELTIYKRHDKNIPIHKGWVKGRLSKLNRSKNE